MDRFAIRQGSMPDIEYLCALDEIAQTSGRRRAFIARSIQAGACYVACTTDGVVVGYAVLDYTFYENAFVAMLYVHRAHRRSGVATALMSHLESLCRTPKLFTSTNLSNIPMQTLLTRLGYTLCGVIHHLDEHDPEIVYVKYVPSSDC